MRFIIAQIGTWRASGVLEGYKRQRQQLNNMSTLYSNETSILKHIKIENGIHRVPKKFQRTVLEIKMGNCSLTEKRDGFCKAVWDGIACWPSVEANKTIKLACPDYIDGFRVDGLASKTCDENGEWKKYRFANFSEWTNYSLCAVERGPCEGRIFVSVSKKISLFKKFQII